MIPILGAIFGIVDKLIPDKSKADELKAQIAASLSQIDLGQLAINNNDSVGNWYQRGWRPTAAYVCIGGIAIQFLLRPILGIWGIDVPTQDISNLIIMLSGILGLSGYRMVEKLNRVA